MLISLFLLIVLFIVAFLSAPTVPSQSNWDNMWNCMGDWMSGGYTTSNTYGSVFGISLVVLVGLVIVGIGGFIYFQFFPEIKTTSRGIQQNSQTQQNSPPMGSVLKTLKEDERKVVDVLMNHDGRYLQKYVRKEAGLSRLKTHRVLARLAEREIVTLQKTGNTNEVQIAYWLKD
jgi:predicted transcriptional regulator